MNNIRMRMVALAFATTGLAQPLSAQDALPESGEVPAPERLMIAFSEHPEWVDVQALAHRLTTLAHVTVVGSEQAEGAAMLTVEWHSPSYARVAVTRPQGTPTARLVELPSDASERVETLAILATNLLRDESAELLAMLRRAPDPAAAYADVPPEPTPPIIVLVENQQATEEPVAPEAVEPVAPEPATDALLEEEDIAPSPPFLRLGLAGHLGSVPSGSNFDLDLIAGLEVAWTAPEWLAIGVRDINVGAISRNADVHVDFAPFIELGVSIEFLTLYGQLGAHLQVTSEERAGVAPMTVIGARFRLIPEFSIGVETALRVVASDAFETTLYELPQGSMPWTAGLAFLFHIS